MNLKPFEYALVKECATKCAFEMNNTLKLFKDISNTDKISVRNEIEQLTKDFLKGLQNANRN